MHYRNLTGVEAIASLHPALAKLEAAIATVKTSRVELDRSMDDVRTSGPRIDAGFLLDQAVISEKSKQRSPFYISSTPYGSPEPPIGLVELRSRLREQLLRFLCSFCSFSISHRKLRSANSDAAQAVREALEVMPTCDQTLKEVFQARLVEAHRCLSFFVDYQQMDDQRPVLWHAIAYQRREFQRLKEALETVGNTYPEGPSSFVGLVSCSTELSILPLDSTRHPCTAKLSMVIEQCQMASSSARSALAAVVGDQENERSHDEQMVRSLLVDDENAEPNLGEFTKRRALFDSQRQVFLAALSRLTVLRVEAISTLKEAVAEAASANHASGSLGEEETILRNNCLAADRILRRLGQEISDWRAQHASPERSSSAIDSEFRELFSPRIDLPVPRLRSSAWY